MEQQKFSFSAGGNAKIVQPFWRQFGSFLQNETYLYHTIQPIIGLLSIYSKKLETYIYTKICAWIFIAALFKCQDIKTPRCPSVGKWTTKLWCIQTMKHYLALNRNELSIHEDREVLPMHMTKWKHPIQNIDILHHNYVTFWKRQTMETEKRLVVARERDE